MATRLDLKRATKLPQAFLHSAKPDASGTWGPERGFLFRQNPSARIFDFDP